MSNELTVIPPTFEEKVETQCRYVCGILSIDPDKIVRKRPQWIRFKKDIEDNMINAAIVKTKSNFWGTKYE